MHIIILNFVLYVETLVEPSVVANGRGSPDMQKVVPINNVASLLGLGRLGVCAETYSRKVFIGGLPTDVDESN